MQYYITKCSNSAEKAVSIMLQSSVVTFNLLPATANFKVELFAGHHDY